MKTRISLADELVDFVKPFKPDSPDIDILRAVLKHIEFETLAYVRDEHGMAGAARFNIVGDTAHVLDLIIRKDCERKGMIKRIASIGWARWPTMKYITFDRFAKHPGRPTRKYELGKLLGVK